MKYCVVIMDGAAGWAMPERNNQTCLELARTPNLDKMARNGLIGQAKTIPDGLEASSAVACTSIMGYDPREYSRGRAAIESRSMGIKISDGEAVFRANLVTVLDGKMTDYSGGHITTEEAGELVQALNATLGNDSVSFYPGISYRHICKLGEHPETLAAYCTPPHDISEKPIKDYLPRGKGSSFLRNLMQRSVPVLTEHPVNKARIARDEHPANMLWLFWGSGYEEDIPSFEKVYGKKAAVTSAVDVLRGLAQMMNMSILEIEGVTDQIDNDYQAQVTGAIDAFKDFDAVIIHVEATDEAAHAGNVEEKIEAIEYIDEGILSKLLDYKGEDLRVLVMPDHPTPIATRTHAPDPVPFLIWGNGITANGAQRFTEDEAAKMGVYCDPACLLMGKLFAKEISF